MTSGSRILLVVLLALGASPRLDGQAPPELLPDSGGASAPTLAMRSYRLASGVLGESRRIRVFFPPSFGRAARERTYPVAIVFDGETLGATVATVAGQLAGNGQVPEMLVVGIENFGRSGALDGNQKRVWDLTPPGLSVSGSDTRQGRDRMLDFIERELLPALDRRFRGGMPRVMVGHSSGGILATYAAATRPAFRVVISLDAPVALQEHWLVTRLIESARGGRASLRYAALGARFEWPEAEWERLVAAAPPDWQLERDHFGAEGHETMTMVGAYFGLRNLFADYSRLALPTTTLDAGIAHYEQVAASLGAPVVPPRSALAGLVERALGEGRADLASRALDRLVAGYGEQGDVGALRERIAMAAAAPTPMETVASLLATPFSSPAEAQDYLGEWVGDLWMGDRPAGRDGTRLRIRVEGGKLVGETVSRGPDGASRIRTWEYLRVTARGLSWGFLNGMDPRGVALFEGVLSGDRLDGRMRIAGLAAVTDVGPPLHFSFRRVPR